MGADPFPKRQHRFRHRAPQRGQAVFDLRRTGRQDLSGHDAVALETAPNPEKRKDIVWRIERKLAEAAVRPVLFYPAGKQ
jgi:hypothetical protein